MSGLGYLAGAVLAAVLTVAAGAKLRSPASTRMSLRRLGMGRASAPLAIGVPVVELVVAAGLVVAPRYAGLPAIALLASFTAVLVATIRSGEAVGCACFGGTANRPVGPPDVVRNLVLAALAALAVVGGGPAPIALADLLLAGTVAVILAVLAALWQTRRTLGRLWPLDLPTPTALEAR